MGEDKLWVQEWLLNNPQLHAASIMTANTYGLKGGIKALARGMGGYTPLEVQDICNQIEDDVIPDELYQSHKDLIDGAQEILGVIDSFGRHAAGIVLNTDTLDDTMGTQTISGWDYPVSQIAMKEIDYCNWTKFDVLGLDNMGLITRTCELAGLPFLTPDSTDIIDFNDENVWKSMRDFNVGIFQFEGDRAGKLLKDLFSDETLARIRTDVRDVNYIDLLSLCNAAQRPSGASYVEAVTEGKRKDNGHKALNDFLAPTLGYLVYQEQIMEFLVKFCGYSAGMADLIRRGIGKKSKEIMDNEVPKIKPAFIKTMIEKYGDSREHAEIVADDFIQVFMDAVNYGFSVNHSMAYSYIGYISTWLRYYYPLEWCTAAFEVWQDKQDKIEKVQAYARDKNIKLSPVKFGKSKGTYYMDKEENVIYEGVGSIKTCNVQTGDSLYTLKNNNYVSFTQLLLDIYDNKVVDVPILGTIQLRDIYEGRAEINASDLDGLLKSKEINAEKVVSTKFDINKSKMINLISLDFFSVFGNSKKLTLVYENFRKNYKPNNKLYKGKNDKYIACLEYEKDLLVEDYPLAEKLTKEMELLGHCQTLNKELSPKIIFITNINVLSNKTRIEFYSPKKGKTVTALIKKTTYRDCKFNKSDLLIVSGSEMKPKLVKTADGWKKSKTQKELWVTNYQLIVKGSE